MEKKIDRRILRSKNGLKKALLELMAQKPFSSITITEIVKCADFNRGTFYAHYEDKEALLEDIMNDLLKDMVTAFRKPYEDAHFAHIPKMPASAFALFEHIYKNASIYKLMADQKVLPEFREKMLNAMKSMTMNDLTGANEASYQEEGINVDLYLTYQHHAILGIAFYWIQQGLNETPQYMADQLVRFLQTNPHKLMVSQHNGLIY